MQPEPLSERVPNATAPPPERTKHDRRGRPTVLDEGKRREVCALVAGGCGLREAAKYVRCSVTTIKRESSRNPAFAEQLRNSQNYSQIGPLRSMQQAATNDWRAAAWLLERAFPDRFARPESGGFGAREARRLLDEVISVVSSELLDPFKSNQIEKRIRGAFEYHIRVATDRRRTTQNLRRTMSFLDQRDRAEGPLAQFGIPTPGFDLPHAPVAAPVT